ncbi:MAG: chromophore lyase CpcT/CpeT [bacterium]|nr:chromophore lyase CpcT/CpeT [bacterium]
MTTAVRTLSILTILAGAAAVLTGCGGFLGEKFYDYTPPTPPDMQLLAFSKLMTGSFSSAPQAAADPEFRDIRLEMSQIWPARSDGVWLYVEQTVAGAPAPYRQRVYRLTRKDADSYVSDVYTLPDETSFAGAWNDPARFAALTPEQLTPKPGCGVTLDKVDDYTYKGATTDKKCASELDGATYATSEVTVTAMWLKSWDRGYDNDGQQVWGAIKGPYIFTKTK